jgi:transcriptional regulator with XRE-family HTH domain/tetratricopeptide (TPR) repeat protein
VPDAAARALGRKVAFHRTQRGLSQRDFGAMIDRSETWVSQVERGVRRIDRMSVLRHVADALDVPLNELAADTPVVVAATKAAEPAHQLRMLLSTTMGLAAVTAPKRPGHVTALTRDVDRAWELTHGTGFGELVPLIIELLPRLEIASRSSVAEQRSVGCTLLARTYQAAAAVLVKLGEIDAAWVASDRAIEAAERAGDPLMMAAGAFRLVLVFQADRRHDQAAHTAETALEAIGSLLRSGDPPALSVAGALRLQLAVTAGRTNDPDKAYRELEAARRMADRLGEDRNDFDTEFGPTNVRLHEVAVAVDLGDAGRALRTAAGIDAAALSTERQSRLLIDVARAHLQRRNVSGTIRALVDAERLAPEHVHTHRLVKNILYDLARSEHRSDPVVRGLAQRSGVRVR